MRKSSRMKPSVLLCALLICTAWLPTFGKSHDKSAGWPLDDQVLANVLESQLDCGAWAKNLDKLRRFDEGVRAKIAASKGDAGSATIDNDATTAEIRYLLRHHAARSSGARERN